MTHWTVYSYIYAAALSGLTAYFLFGLPIQLTDSFANLLSIQSGSVWEVFRGELNGTGYLRPMLQTQLKIVYELAGGHYFVWFRTVQAVQVLAVLLLSVRLLQPRRLADFAIVPCMLAMVLGLHTFAGTIREAFPINTFLTLVLCCLAAANLARTRGGWVVDICAAVLLACSLFTLETGVLVWVIFVASRALGERGVSWRGVALATAVLGGYFVVRFMYLHIGAPGFSERSTGFGFRMLAPSEVIARFGNDPLPLYVYNYLSAIFTVLFAEPRGAVWQFVAGLSMGTVPPWEFINVVSSTLTTGVLVWYIARRAPLWMRRSFGADDYVVLLFLAVLSANALLCLVYVKDVIMSPAGVLYALAAAIAMRQLLTDSAAIRRRIPAGSAVVLALISIGWGWRLLGIHYNLRDRAMSLRTEWAYEDEWESENQIRIATADATALKRTLLDDAIWRRPAPPRLDIGWARELRQDAIALADDVFTIRMLAVGGPALGAFLMLLSFVILKASGGRPFAIAPPANVAEAAAYGDAARMLALIQRGDDPNARWPTRPDLIDSQDVRVTAVQAAILARRPEAALLLLRRGARPEDPRSLACLSQAVGQDRDLPGSVFGAPDACGVPFD